MPARRLASRRDASMYSLTNPQHHHYHCIDKRLPSNHYNAAMTLETISRLRPIQQRNHLAQNQSCYRGLSESGKLDRVLRDEQFEQQKN